MVDWLIIGGGPHGIHMAKRLLDRGVPLDRIAIVDPNAEPLARWKHHTENVGMSHLRSPEVHHLDIRSHALGHHAKTEAYLAAKQMQNDRGSGEEQDFIPPYSRPSLHLFMHHARTMVEEAGLMRCWKLGRAASIRPDETGYLVRLEAGERIPARNVVLALGIGDELHWPTWARRLKAQKTQAKLHHIFAPDFQRKRIEPDHEV
ncbi:MAG: FAD/NAD(P)-binding protein, partial [Verrucomicrobiota bacterium]